MRQLSWTGWLVVIASLVWACQPNRQDPTAKPLDSRILLKALGPVIQQVYPGEVVRLKVVALKTTDTSVSSEDDVARAVDQAIAWQLISGANNATISAPVVTTDASGIAEITVNTGQSSGLIQVNAVTTGANAVSFTVSVRPDVRVIEVLSSTQITTVIDRNELIRLRVSRPSEGGIAGAPMADVEIPVVFVGGARNDARITAGEGSSATLITDNTGVATLYFQTGGLSDVSYELLFCQAGSCPGTGEVSVTIVVVRAIDGEGECTNYFDCDEGYVCIDTSCSPVAAYCDEDTDCPTGYQCAIDTTRTCVERTGAVCGGTVPCPDGEICGAAGVCIDEDGCTSDAGCPPTWTCNTSTGICSPPPNTPAMDVRNEWHTYYHFDISKTLGPISDLGPVLDLLNVLVFGDIEFYVPLIGNMLDAVIDALVAEYVEDWWRPIIRMLGDLVYVFQDVDVEGQMKLFQTPTTPVLGTLVSGEEKWTRARVYVPSKCFNTQTFNQNPQCAATDVIMTPSIDLIYSDNDVEVGVKMDPFNGQVVGDKLVLHNRHVELEMRQLINVVIDLVVLSTSNGQSDSLQNYLRSQFPCQEISKFIEEIICDLTDGDLCDISALAFACQQDAMAAGKAFEEWLGKIPVVLNLDFDQTCKIHDTTGDGKAESLGDPDNRMDNNESALLGGTEMLLIFGGEFDDDSWWYGDTSFTNSYGGSSSGGSTWPYQ